MRNLRSLFSQKIEETLIHPYRLKGKTKIFGIGRNKTGTTSLKKAFEDLGVIVGKQRRAEKLLLEYKAGNFEAIKRYCNSAQFFQDFPFSFPETFKFIDNSFPNSKFVLTVRTTSEQWYDSLVKFHSKRFGKGQIPTKEDLVNASYVWKGWMWECNRLMYNTPESDPYNREILIKSYVDYNNTVKEYFKNRPKDLIIIDLSEKEAYRRLMEFLNIQSPFTGFPWENKTDQINIKK